MSVLIKFFYVIVINITFKGCLMNVTIVPFLDKYQNKTTDLIFSIQEEELKLNVSLDERDDLQDIAAFYMKDNSSLFCLALYKDNVVGTISISYISKRKMALHNMYIHKDFRGTLYDTANKLLKESILFANNHMAREIYLGTGLDFYAAHKFYEKNGFMEVEKEVLPSDFPFMSCDEKFYELIL